jgi:hypothetical protein
MRLLLAPFERQYLVLADMQSAVWNPQQDIRFLAAQYGLSATMNYAGLNEAGHHMWVVTGNEQIHNHAFRWPQFHKRYGPMLSVVVEDVAVVMMDVMVGMAPLHILSPEVR